MRRRQVLLALVAVLFLAAPAQVRPAQDDRDQLQGTWELAAVEVNQQRLSLKDLKEDGAVMVGTLVVQGNRYSFRLGSKGRLELTCKLYPDAMPKAIDLTVTEGPQKGKIYHGIYRLERDSYTVCRHVEPGKARPISFFTAPDSGRMRVVWKRVTPP
jgi:uncharacterized protein (TIGR03067 family)